MTEIGKVSVRVIPDTRGFASKAKRDLKRLKDLSFKVDVELNERQFNAQVKRLIAKTNSELMKPENHIKFRASLEASNRQLSSEVRDVRRRMQAMADEERIEFKAELDKKLGKKGKGGLLQLDPKGAVKELKRELGGERYELPVFANTDGVKRDLRRLARNRKLDINVDLLVDRKKVYDEVDSISKLLETAAKAVKRTDALKFQIDVDKGSVKKWTKSVKEVEASLETQRKIYKDTQREIQIVNDRSADYAKTVSEATKQVTKLKAQQKADAQREADLTEELLEVRRVIAKSAGDITEETLREKRLVGQIEKMRHDAFEASAKRAEAEAKAVQDIRDASREIQKLEEKRAKLRASGLATSGQIEKLEINHDKLQKELDRARNKLEMDAIELDVNLDQASTEAVAARLAVLARDRIVTIFTRIQKNSLSRFEKQMGSISGHSKDLGNNIVKWVGQLAGVRVMWRSFRDMVDWLPQLDMMVPELARNFSLLTGAVTGTVGALGMAFTLLSDIGEVGKLALIGPAGLAALGAFGVILNSAFNKNYIKELVPDLVASFQEMQEVLGGSFWKGAEEGFLPFLEKLISLGKTLGKTTASDLGEFFGQFGRGSMSILDKEGPRFFKNLSKFMDNASQGAFALGHAFTRLAGVGSDSFGAFGEWFSEKMVEFDGWVEKNASNGNITRWIQDAATALTELGSIAVSSVKIIAGVADAFNQAGWPGLTELEAGMRAVADFALALKDNDSFMQPLEQMHDFFAEFANLGPQVELSMKNLWGMIGDSAEVMAKPLADAMGYILDGFNSAKFQSGFGKFISGIASFVDDVGPGLGAMTEEIGSLLGVVGTAAESWGPAYNDMLLLFANSGDLLHPGLLDFVENLGPRLQDLITDITPHVEDFSRALGDLLGNENFQDLVGDLIGDLGDLGGMILDLGTWVVETAGKFSDWYGGLGEGGQDLVRWTGLLVGFGTGALVVLGGALIKVAGFFKKVGDALKILKIDKLFSKLANTKAGKAIGNFFKGIGGALKGFPKAAIKSVMDLLGRFGSYLAGWGPNLRSAAATVTNGLKGFASRLGGAVKNLIPNIKLLGQWLGTKLSGIFSALKNSRLVINAGQLLSKITTPLKNFVRGIPRALGKVLPKGGLLKMAGKALTRFIPVVGWVLILRDALNLIKPVGVLEWAEGILRGLGLDSLANIVEAVKDNIAQVFGEDVGLMDLFSPVFNAFSKAWDGAVEGWKDGGLWGAIKGFGSGFIDGLLDSFQLLWENIKDAVSAFAPEGVIDFFDDPWGTIKEWIFGKEGDITAALAGSTSSMHADLDFSDPIWGKARDALQTAWDNLVNFFSEWNPVALGFKFGTWLGEKLRGWLGIEEGGALGEIPSLEEIANWGTTVWNDHILPKLGAAWDALVNFFLNYTPIGLAFKFAGWLGEKIGTWLGAEDPLGEIPSLAEIANWGSNLWNEKIKPKLQSGWDKLVGFWREWNPISLGFKVGSWIGDKIKDWLGFGENGLDFSSFSVDFDFTSLWENKIKPALTTGLLALAGLILAPGLVLIAPLALPPLIIGWLLGRDGEGNWSFQELTDKITGAWESIKGALTAGVDAIKGFVGGLVMAPIAIATKIVDWLLGTDWVEKAKNGLTTAIANAGPALKEGIDAGVKAVETVATGGGGTAGAQAGGALRRVLGIDEPGKGRIKLDFGAIGGWVKQFGGDTRSEYGTTATATGGSMDKMRNTTKGRFSDIKADALRKAKDMQLGVGRNFQTMKSDGSSKTGQMQTDVTRKMEAMRSQAAAKALKLQVDVVRHMAAANAQSVKQAGNMSRGYVAVLRAMSSTAISVARAMKQSLLSVLSINAAGAGRTTGNTFRSGLSGALNAAVSLARGIRGRIRGALSFSAYSSGSSIGSSFASGLRARIGSVSSAASQLAAAARRKMPNSPADEGPFSGSGWGGWGESIAEELAKGLRKSAPEVAREAEKLMGGVHSALDARSNATVGIDFERTRRRYGLASDGEEQATGTTVNVNVESRSEDPLREEQDWHEQHRDHPGGWRHPRHLPQ